MPLGRTVMSLAWRGVYTCVQAHCNPVHLVVITINKLKLLIVISGEYVPPASPDIGDEYEILPHHFKYQLQYEDTDAEEAVSRAVGLTLKRTMEHKASGLVTLLFDLVLAPSKSFK